MINVEEIKIKILNFLENNGPSLPIHISREIELSQVFTSAILSELVSAQKIKMSKLKIGSSPLYLLHKQEENLEKFAEENFKGIEKTAYLKLKKEKIIDDLEQEPALRVALRSIKDFAIPIKFNERIVWKYAFIDNEEAKNLLTKTTEKKSIKENTQTKEEDNKKNNEIKEKITIKKEENKLDIFDEKEKRKKPKVKINPEEFLLEVKTFLNEKEIRFIQEMETTKKEIIAKVQINSDLGKINFLLVAKNKKRPSLSDLSKAKKEANFERMPCLFIARGEPVSTAQDFLEENKNLLKTYTF